MVCESKEADMKKHCTVTTKSDVKHISIKVRIKQTIAVFLTLATLLVSGYGDGLSPSALAY